jgi:hypothetical protein
LVCVSREICISYCIDGNRIDFGYITFTGGVATGISGTWTSPANKSSGIWTMDAANSVGAGPKTGTWSIPQKTPPTRGLAVIIHDGGSLSCVATHKKNGQLTGGEFSGNWNPTSDQVTFTISDGGDVTGGNGTYNPVKKTGSGHLYNGATPLGTWTIKDL